MAAGTLTVSSTDLSPVTIRADTTGISAGDNLTQGVRPHAIVTDEGGTLVGTVALIERPGNETNVNLTLPSGITWLAVLDGDHSLSIGQKLALTFSPDVAMLFDRTERARHPAGN